MTRIFVDVATAALEVPGTDHVDLDAVRSLRLLAEAGHEVVLVTGSTGPPPPALGAIAADAVGAVPSRPTGRAWYLTADVERCRGTSARVHTVLVGAAPLPGSVRRCDAVARDVQAAVMEILASEAMPSAS